MIFLFPDPITDLILTVDRQVQVHKETDGFKDKDRAGDKRICLLETNLARGDKKLIVECGNVPRCRVVSCEGT